MMHLSDGLIPKFSGRDKTYPAAKWIQDVEETAEEYGWTSVQKLLIARLAITGTAALWLRTEETFKTWDALKDSLLEEFPDDVKSEKCVWCYEFGHVSLQCASTAGTTRHQDENGGLLTRQVTCVTITNKTNDNDVTQNENEPDDFLNVTNERHDETSTSFDSAKMAPQKTTVSMDVTDNTDKNNDDGQMSDRNTPAEIILCEDNINALTNTRRDVNLIENDCYQDLDATENEQKEIYVSGLGSTRVYTMSFTNTDATDCYVKDPELEDKVRQLGQTYRPYNSYKTHEGRMTLGEQRESECQVKRRLDDDVVRILKVQDVNRRNYKKRRKLLGPYRVERRRT